MKEHKTLNGKFQVLKEHLAIEIGSGNMPVLGTPALIGFMENIASDLIQKDLTPDLSSVGVSIEMNHIKASQLDDVIIIHAKITKRKNKTVCYKIEAFNEENDLLGKAKHKRIIVNRKNFEAKVFK